MSKSAIYVANTGTQSVPVDGTISLGSIIRRFGCGVDLNGTGITISEPGYYEVNVSVTVAPTAIGPVTVTLLNNGVAVPGAIASEAVSTANNHTNLSFDSIVRVFCGSGTGSLTLVLSGTDSNVTNVATVVTKL